MSCKDIEHKLPAYLEDALSPEEKGIVEGHLASCPRCSKTLDYLEKTGKLVRELEEVEPPPWFTQRIMSRVREEATQKESLFRKIFFPLHIKIPIQALATVLIAVLAFQIYRAGDPSMKGLVAPPAIVFKAGQDQAPATPQKPPEAAPARIVKEKAAREGAREDTGMVTAPSLDRGDEGIRKEQKLVRQETAPSTDKPVVTAKKREAPVSKDADIMDKATLMKQQISPKALSAPMLEYKRAEREGYGSAVGGRGKYEAAPAAPRVMGTVSRQVARVGVAVHVRDTSDAAREVETLLGTLDARKIHRYSQDEREILIAELKEQQFGKLMQKLKTIGKTEEKGVPDDIREQYISVIIEIIRDR